MARWVQITAEAYAQAQLLLLPPGRLFKRIGSLLLDAFTGAGDELERISGRIGDMIRESVAENASELIEEYEADLGLDGTGTTAERVEKIVARLVARQGFRPVDLQEALAGLLGLDPAQVEIIEISSTEAAGMDDPTQIYKYYVFRDPALGGSYDLEAAQELLESIEHSHTDGFLIESDDFLTDDAESLTDRDILGV
jgi:hypothetical protein